MEINKCPNCLGKMQLNTARNRMVCMYCGSEFSLPEETKKPKKTQDSKKPTTKNWFTYEWNEKKLRKKSEASTCIDGFLKMLNEYETSAEVEEYMRTYLMNYFDCAAIGINEERLNMIKERIADRITRGEHIVIYGDDAILNKGRTGIVITNKRTLFLTKNKITEILHTSVPYLQFGCSLGLPEIKLGDKYLNNIGAAFAGHHYLVGCLGAYICFCSFENKPDRPAIPLKS